jgi:uncharacterized damage-inducible protein DinB
MGQSTAAGFNLSHALITELQHEAQITRTVLERVPTDKFDYRPHEKSMTFGELASHVVDTYNWYQATLTLEELDFATTDYTPFKATSTEDLLDALDKGSAAAAELLASASDADLMVEWTMKAGEQVHFSMPRIAVIRGMLMNHMIHHRGQLSVYLRMNDIPVPQIYGPSADEGQPPT